MPERWLCRNFSWAWNERPLLMGIINVTPDSFSNGGECFSSETAIERAYQFFEEGADLVDVGGESSRPGADAVPAAEEIRRVLPVVAEIAGKGRLPVSIDTVKYEVAAAALQAGAAVLNDISGLQMEPRLAELAAQTSAGLILMHMRGTPRTMQSLTEYPDLIAELRRYFQERIALALSYGVHPEQLALDPGIGFSKTAEQNLILIRRLRDIRMESYPMLLGVSRKSFIGKITGKEADQRLLGTAAAVAAGVLGGANILRVHDVREMKEVLEVASAIERAGEQTGRR